ncbi:MAG: hypothetical protein IIA00_00190 [Proteobacteria bacterium]|nr:hypothetical protein [Pseudomonadota bacterium]
MFNPDPEKFYTLPLAFDVLGRARFPKMWTGKELRARDLPPPAATFRRIRQAEEELRREDAEDEQRARREQAEKVERARRASFRVRTGTEVSRRPHRRSVPEPMLTADEVKRQWVERVASRAGYPPEIVEAAEDQPACRREHRARWRRNAIEGDIRRLLHDLRPQPVLQKSSDGRRAKIPSRLWFAGELRVQFDTGEASWPGIDTAGREIVYQGLVLIERAPFDHVVSGEPVDEDARGEDSRELETAAEEAAQQRPLVVESHEVVHIRA